RSSRLSVGANFNFLFGGIEQTRTAIYPTSSGFSDTRAFTSLVLRAPTYDVGFLFTSQLIAQERVAVGVERRKKRYEARVAAWREAHPGVDVPFSAPRVTQAVPWRFNVGLTVAPLTRMSATYTQYISSFTANSTGTETFRDTISYTEDSGGKLELPLDLGFGVSVHNDRWMITAEMHRRDWNALKVDVDGYALPTGLKAANTYALGAKFQPSYEGGLFARTIYRAGLRYTEDYRVVPGGDLNATAFTLGLSLPLNAAQTNSYVHIGAEVGQRGTTEAGLIQEQYVMLRIGLSITPWKGERWFVPSRIQ
ncbi:MAG TPA: hypothetical protein VHL57_09645, partial [Flavobacteriales bacterium]|nr:hypothetical protein [Flavobacteriales bacterium]